MHALAAPLKALHRRPPASCQDDSVERMAAELDWLRHHVESHGSVVAKQPDVWGQNRLTRHRAEYEEQLRAQLGAFLELNHASLRQSDQSFLGLALALDEAAAPSPRATRPAAATANVTTMISNPATGSGNEAVIARSAPFAATAQPFATFGLDAATAVGLEPTIHLDHLARYLNHLHELRRINEGDDVADSPGYALNLVRIPVSITPGQHTQAGHGAEITITAEPLLGDDLLPTTFQNLVVNDLVDLLAPGLTYAVNTGLVRAALEGSSAPTLPPQAFFGTRSRSVSVPSPKTRRARMPLPPEQLVEAIGEGQIAILLAGVHEALATDPASGPCIDYSAVRGFLLEELRAATDFLAQPRQAHAWAELPAWNLAEAVRSRRAGDLELRRRAFFESLGADLPPAEPIAGPVGLPQPAWEPTGAVPPPDGGLPAPCGSACANTLAARCLCRTTTAVLAWAVLVESALLDERLVDDMRETAAAKGLCDGSAVAGPFYGPRPAPEARAAFNSYVRARWPLRVFALDPVTQEQNVEELSSRRREMQLAMALAASSGRANAQALARYAHRLEIDMATVSLNKTAVGFTHGADTFGWRFYPRMQPPPARGNLGALADTLCGTNPTVRDLASRRLEPGVRECTAIIVMPSFVPFVTFAVQSGWFSLVHPQAAEPTMRRALTLSRSVKAVQQSAAVCAQGEHCYRDGDVAHLMRALEQLDRRLPFQTMVAQIPHENTGGGFELFSTGITDLAPDLIGWYGAAGIDPSGTSTLFLLGRGFSVHDTSAIAGGRPAKVTLLGRQLARVEIPPGARTIRPALDPRCGGRTGLARHGGPPLV
ncbi:MAG: hypothetical protein ACKOTB_11635, partial [Planctomycetia bacterium]